MINTSAAPRARRSRKILSNVMLALAGILVPVAVCLLWLAFVVLDADRFTRTVTPIIDIPAVQSNLASALNSGVRFSITNASETSPSIRSMIAVAGGTDVVLREISLLVDQALASPEFRVAWAEMNRIAHADVKRLLRGESLIPGISDETLTLTFTDIQAVLQADPNSPVGRVLDAVPAKLAPYVNVLKHTAEIPAASYLIAHAESLAISASVACAVLIGLGLWLSTDRRRALIILGAFGLVSLVVALVVRTLVTETLSDLHGVEGELAREYAGTLTSSLESALWLIAATGAIVALLAWIWPKLGHAASTEASA